MTSTRRCILPLVLGVVGTTGCMPERSCTEWCGTAVVAFYSDARTLLPPLVVTDVGNALSDQLFLKLADVGTALNTVGDTGFVPRLAERWEFEDPRTLRFDLNPEARWHDGVPVRARDVEFTFATYRHPEVGSIASPRLRDITSVTARDSLTVVFRFRRQYLEQFFDAVYHMRIIPYHLLAATPPESLRTAPFARQPIGNGPFRFERWNADESGELVADSTFFLGRPGFRRLIWRAGPDPASTLTQVITEDADLLNYVFPTVANIRLVTETDHLRLHEFSSNAYNYISFNLKDPERSDQPHWLFDDRDVRRALVMAVDREAVIQGVLGEFGELLPGPVTRIQWIWNDDFVQLPYDTARARATLRAAGWRDADGDGLLERRGEPLRFELVVPSSSASRVQASVIIQEQLKRVGIDMQIVRVEFTTYIDRVTEGRFDAQFASVSQDPSPVSLEDWTGAGLGGLNYGSYVNPEFDRRVREAADTYDRRGARTRWKSAVDLLNGDAPAIWVYLPKIAAAVHARFENVSFRPDAWWATLWTWEVNPALRIPRDHVAP